MSFREQLCLANTLFLPAALVSVPGLLRIGNDTANHLDSEKTVAPLETRFLPYIFSKTKNCAATYYFVAENIHILEMKPAYINRNKYLSCIMSKQLAVLEPDIEALFQPAHLQFELRIFYVCVLHELIFF